MSTCLQIGAADSAGSILTRKIDSTGAVMKSFVKRVSKKKRTLAAVVMAIYHVLGVISTVDTLITTRTIQDTIAWAGSRALKT